MARLERFEGTGFFDDGRPALPLRRLVEREDCQITPQSAILLDASADLFPLPLEAALDASAHLTK